MPSREEIIGLLKGVHLFSELDRSQLRALAGIAKGTEEYRRGAVICHQGEPGKRYLIVQEGSLRITHVDAEGRVLEVRRVQPGQALGETSLLLGDVRDATVEALEPVVLLYIEKQDFDHLLEEQPEIERALRMRPETAERRRYPRFSWLETGELPIKVLHKHAAVLIPGLLIPGLIWLALLLTSALAERLWGPFALVVGLVLTVVPLGAGLYIYLDWRNDVYIVTNRRVVHQERIGLVREKFSAAPLHAIQDVQQIQIGLVARLYRFGDLVIDTAGGAGQVVFRSIPRPGRVRDAIFEQRMRTQALARAVERTSIQEAMHGHFLEEDDHAEEEPTERPEEGPRRPGCLLAPLAVLRMFVPPTWHREGATVTWRKHWMALIRTIGLPVLVFLLTTTLVAVIASTLPDLLPTVIVFYALAAFILIPWFLWQFEDWQNDFYQVTAARVIHVERLPFYLREERREASLEQITNVRFDQSLAGQVFKYGDVVVETAAPAGVFNFVMVSRPREVQAEIFAHIEAARRRRHEQDAERHRAELLDWFSVYDEMRRTTHPPSHDEEAE